tara:strand:+ start:1112 stop:1819 length:708 start_codon:yes stop_codon:yes gene_type:complete
MIKKIVVTGGSGRFGNILKKVNNNFNLYFPKKSKLNIENYKSIEKYLKKIKPNYFVHCAALSRPMDIHDLNIVKSINTNIIGTCNVVKACEKFNIKLIYFSTNYVYPKKKGLYKETDPVFPFNNYGWSKLGGEAAVQMYKNSLILRICMTEKPFAHKKAFYNVKSNFIFHDDVTKILFKLINLKGILNVGGPVQSIYKFAKKYNQNIKKSKCKIKNIPLSSVMNISKLKKKIKKW